MNAENDSVPQDLRFQTDLPIDASLNFLPEVLGAEDVQLIRAVLPDTDIGVVGALNTGLPMPPYLLDALMNFRVRHRYIKARPVLEEAIVVAIMVNHYYASRAILETTAERLDQLFTGPDRERLEAGTRRLFRAVAPTANPEPLLEAVGDTDLPDGAYSRHVSTVYDLLTRAGLSPTPAARQLYPHLATFNYLYLPPKYLTAEAVHIYARNLSALTRRRPEALQTLTAAKRSKDPEDVTSDILFALSLGNCVVRHQTAVRTLRRYAIGRLSRLCSRLYVAYTQVPETRAEYREVAAETVRVVNGPANDDAYSLAPVVRSIFRLVRRLAAADVYINPEFVTYQAFSAAARRERLQGATIGMDEDLDVELDPRGPYTDVPRHTTNPYTCPELFACPRNLALYLSWPLKKQLTQELAVSLEGDDITFESYLVESLPRLIEEGAAAQLRMYPSQLRRYLELTPPPAEVTADSEDLFADVDVRPLPRRRRRYRLPCYANVRGARPPSLRRSPAPDPILFDSDSEQETAL